MQLDVFPNFRIEHPPLHIGDTEFLLLEKIRLLVYTNSLNFDRVVFDPSGELFRTLRASNETQLWTNIFDPIYLKQRAKVQTVLFNQVFDKGKIIKPQVLG